MWQTGDPDSAFGSVTPMTGQIRVAIADDSSRVRASLRTYLEECGIEVVAEAENGEQAIRCLTTGNVDVLVLDVSMPTIDGLTVLRHLRNTNPLVRVIVLTGCDVSQLPRDEAWDIADDFFLKIDCEPLDLVASIRRSARRARHLDAANDAKGAKGA